MKKLMIISLACALGCGMHAMAQTINDLEAPKHLTATTAPLKDAGFDPSGKSALANIISNVSLNSTLNNGADAKLQAAYQFSPTWSANITAQLRPALSSAARPRQVFSSAALRPDERRT